MNNVLIINAILFICQIILLYIINLKTVEKNEVQQKLLFEINSLKREKESIIQNNNDLKEKIAHQLQIFQYQEKQKIQQQKQKEYQQLQNWKVQQRQLIKEQIQNEQILANEIIKHNNQLQQQEKIKINNEFNFYKENIQKEKKQLNNEIQKMRASINAGVQARLREQQKKDKINFYKLSISKSDLQDVEKLQKLKTSFHKPVVLSKLIWSQYFQKKMTELCDRVLSKQTVIGIYKITNLITEQCYIGQSVNINDRWKQHCKCGLGIDASATNVLYNSMQQYGVWNFSFELLEQCSRNELNDKEKFWIMMYQSNIYGLNANKGINK